MRTGPSPPFTAPALDVPREILAGTITQDFDAIPLPTKPIVSFVETPHDRIAIEIMRGCSLAGAGSVSQPLSKRGCRASALWKPSCKRAAWQLSQHRPQRDRACLA